MFLETVMSYDRGTSFVLSTYAEGQLRPSFFMGENLDDATFNNG